MTTPQPSIWANIHVPAFKPVRFIPAASEAAIRGLTVSRFYAAAHKVESQHTTGAKRTNHWAFYIQSTTNDWIRIDVTPSGLPGPNNGGSKANIVISHLPYKSLSNSVEHQNELRLQTPITVGWIVDTIVGAGRDKYEFNAQGVGCRNWIVDQLALLASAFHGPDVQAATNDVSMLWPARTQSPLSSGAGYYS
ncbi:uncharacterized protein BDR25DRAFT_276920 [Lindgomyces ingoldianus]|uniref:Uncharacterized protein n=1 Tax=Lindgomyces ingoldianus TaxID=673940 RepID=A0ACB6RFT0_9PLEO|nr:uncharacterized protein BDR25DRAFT_276920 [Lindgomyces ingoldianus]KAF2477185.1 hypothetical protein BDR25DRAFT_276920 [Lindgomyces ingoldianus]